LAIADPEELTSIHFDMLRFALPLDTQQIDCMSMTYRQNNPIQHKSGSDLNSKV